MGFGKFQEAPGTARIMPGEELWLSHLRLSPLDLSEPLDGQKDAYTRALAQLRHLGVVNGAARYSGEPYRLWGFSLAVAAKPDEVLVALNSVMAVACGLREASVAVEDLEFLGVHVAPKRLLSADQMARGESHLVSISDDTYRALRDLHEIAREAFYEVRQLSPGEIIPTQLAASLVDNMEFEAA